MLSKGLVFPETLPLTDWPGRPGLQILRGDLLNPVVSGNKLFKLRPLLQQATKQKASTLISVGGRYSNHLHALSWAARATGLASVGLVRGFPEQELTPTLADCQRWGMQLEFLPPKDYQERHKTEFWQTWTSRFPESFAIEEGGWSEQAIKGSSQWWQYLPSDIDCVVCAVGSGATLAGLLRAAPQGVRVVGVPVYRDPQHYQSLVMRLMEMSIATEPLELLVPQADRGFGKLTTEQQAFRVLFTETTGVSTDPVYTSKVVHAVDQWWHESEALRRWRTVVIHTGGLQGNRS
ncbi:1-aminocyclopropane-1-carboxylate deaminase/D-cysteine desulfhydrase [Reinekea blandensis]|uniref:1-aminocyclopropane-1-carboxylate deaminase n=1 Tax=Reinekea blandensis MED297 TaxID=314283 RepID=A4BCK7_9GAMM|nr:pyridoxal-phosphate dependent enzyme [Reinekea blandensis]EAR10273.1 1-aminocyclopropane-1-carboxylate deaminase [Reinekea sp. MED297] [Reinekea blandensis MED297]